MGLHRLGRAAATLLTRLLVLPWLVPHNSVAPRQARSLPIKRIVCKRSRARFLALAIKAWHTARRCVKSSGHGLRLWRPSSWRLFWKNDVALVPASFAQF